MGRIGTWFRDQWLTGPGWTGASVGCLVLGLLVWVWRFAVRVIPSAWGTSLLVGAADFLVIAAVALAVLLVGTGLARLFKKRFPVPFLAAFAASAVLVGSMAPGPSVLWWGWVTAVVVLTGSVAGAWIGRRGRAPGRVGKAGTAVVAVAALFTCFIVVWPGSGPDDPGSQTRHGTPLDWAGEQGPLDTLSFTYGAGTGDGRYGEEVEVTSGSVDASEQLGEWGSLRTRAMGFDASELPLNATVWAPDAEAPGEGFPLVLIAHGNSAKPGNELGFGYLGEHLASHGYVVAAVEQTFLNTGLLDSVQSLEMANQMRARVLMEHLVLWEEWAADGAEVPSVDLSRTVLAGHSRGGEAAAVVAALHTGTSDTSVKWPVPELPDVEIVSVVGIAPTAGVIVPVPELEDIDYLTISGTHDADLSTFAGYRQYEHVDPGPDGIAAAVLLDRANHTQFNSGWGRFDTGAGLSTRLLNTGVLLDPEEQRTATNGLITAFLADSVHGDPFARGLFLEDLYEAAWLPGAEVRAAVKAGGSGEPVADFAGADVTREELPLRTGSGDVEVLRVSGDVGFSLEVPDSGPLAFDLADAAGVGERAEPMSVRAGSCDLGDLGATLDGEYGKLPFLMRFDAGEPFLETFTVPEECTDGGDQVEITVSDVGEQGVYLHGVEMR